MCVFVCENQGCLEANTLKLNTYVKKEYQNFKAVNMAIRTAEWTLLWKNSGFIEFWLQTE